MIYFLKFFFYIFLEVCFRLIGDFIHCPENNSLIGLVWYLFAKYPNRSYDKQ